MITSHLMERAGVFYFRRVLPFDVRPFFPSKEIWRSLRTRERRAATRLARRIDSETERIFVLIRSRLLSRTEILRAVKAYYKRTLDGLEDHRDSESTHYEFAEDSPLESLTGNADLLAPGAGAPEAHDGSFPREGLKQRVGYYQAKVTALENQLRELDIDQKLEEQPKATERPLPPAEASGAPPQPPVKAYTTITLSKLIDDYMAESRDKNLDESTYLEYEDACRLLVRIVGEKPATELTREDLKTYRDTIRKLPSHLNKKPELKGKCIDDVLEITRTKGLKTLSVAAVKKKLGQVKALVKWASNEGVRLIPHNVGAGVNIPKATQAPAREQKKPYTNADIQGLVNGLLAEREKGTFKDHPERYWIPLIGVFSGLRLEEISQLHTPDVRQIEGIWCFDVNLLDDAGNPAKRLKTGNAKRLVPIHSTLIELGFLDYLHGVKLQGHPRLWMALGKTSTGKYQRNIKDWYNGADNRPGFENLYIDADPKKSFHSTRHTFANALKQAGADMLVAGEVLGHRLDGLTFDRYGAPYRVEIKQKAVELATYDVDFLGQLGRWVEWY